MDIPLNPTITPHYLIRFANGTTSSIPVLKMQSLTLKPDVDMSNSSHLLPPFLHLNLKITFKHEGQFHKGFLTQSSNGFYCFSYKSHINKKHPDWRVPLPNLHWLSLKGVIVPGHNTHSFVRESTATFVSAANLIWECPCSLLTALADKHPDRDIWMWSFWEEKDSIISMDTYDTITLVDLYLKKVLRKQFPLCASLPSNRTRWWTRIAPNFASLYSEITKTEFDRSQINTPPSYILIPCTS